MDHSERYVERGYAALVGSVIFPYKGVWPLLGADVYFAPGSRVIGDVHIGDGVNVWYNAVVRGDVHFIRIGARSNIQDNATFHVTHDTGPLHVGADVVIGHGAVVHACTIEDAVLVGMNAVILDGAHLETGCMIAAGAVVTPKTRIPSGMLAGGIPAKVIRPLRPEERADIPAGATRYLSYARANREAQAEALEWLGRKGIKTALPGA